MIFDMTKKTCNIFFCFIIIYFVYLLYGPYLQDIVRYWNKPDNSFSYLVVPVFIYILWTSRYDIYLRSNSKWHIGFWGLALSMVIMLLGKYSSLQVIVYISLWGTLLSIYLIAFGINSLKQGLFPFCLLIFVIPLPIFVVNMVSLQLKLWSSALAVFMLQGMDVPVFRAGNIIDVGIAQLQVVDACSGLRYIFPSLFLALILGKFFLRRQVSRFLLAAMSPVICIGANSIRLAVTAILIRYVHPGLAKGIYHDLSGWFIYLFILFTLFILAILLRRFYSQRCFEIQDNRQEEILTEKTSRNIYVNPMAILAVVSVFVIAFATQNILDKAQHQPKRKTFADFPLNCVNWVGERHDLPSRALDALLADDYIAARYTHCTTGNTLNLLIIYHATQTVNKTAHAPTSCLLGSGWVLLNKYISRGQRKGDRDFPVRSMLMQQGEQRMLANFWFDQRGRHITSELLNKLYLLRDSLIMHRTDGALIRVEMLLLPNQSVEQGQKILNNFILEIKKNVQDYIPGNITKVASY